MCQSGYIDDFLLDRSSVRTQSHLYDARNDSHNDSAQHKIECEAVLKAHIYN